MHIQLKRFDQSLPLPKYQTPGSVGLDLAARVATTVPAGQVVRVPLNVALQIPAGHWVMVAARSSLHKRGLMLANGIGVGDQDYCGDNDEYQVPLFNFSGAPVTIEKGERIVQLLILPIEQAVISEVEHFSAPDRGGFGSTGHK